MTTDLESRGTRQAAVPEAGARLGRYRLLAKLGAGGMGAVWKAEDTLLGRVVALKILPEHRAGSTQARRRLVAEARAASALDHRGIATVFDAGEIGGVLYIAGACIDGETVADKVARGPLPVREALRIGRAAADALAHAHERGVIHRDVSSRNIMVEVGGRVVVVDFGLAHASRDASQGFTRAGVVMGTVAYLAPELVQGRPADARTDVYSLGAVVYEMLVGVPPFTAERLEALLYAAVHQPPAPLRARRPAIPPAVERAVLTALAKDPAARFATAAELAANLRPRALERPERVRDRRMRARPQRSAGARPRVAHAARAAPGTKVLVVLPFEDATLARTPDPNAGLFARGLAEAVGAQLSRLPGIQVVPPAAQAARADAGRDPRRAARDAGANLVLAGSVQRAQRKLRVVFTLLGYPRGRAIASETLEGTVSRIFVLEDRLVSQVARALELDGSAPRAAPARGDPAAQEHYLQALGYLQHYENEAAVDGAIGLLEGLLRSEGEDARFHAAMARAYLAKYRLTLERRWPPLARAACQRALELSADIPDVLATLGQLHGAVGRNQEAVEDFRRALRLRPADPDALLGLALVYSASGRYCEAEQACREAIAVRPLSWVGYNRLGVLFFKQGRYGEAAKQWRRVVELAPDNVRGHSNLGAAYHHMGRDDEAIQAYRRSIAIHPNADAFSSLATVLFFEGRYDEAAPMFERAAALRPFDAVHWGNLADACRWIPGADDKAVTALEQAIVLMREHLEVNPSYGKGWCQLAGWLAKRGRSREALACLRRGLRLSPGDVSCRVLAVTVYHLAGDRGRALEALRAASRQGCDRAELEHDPELAGLREQDGFREALEGTRVR
jgi:tetratricopeptide (TPR) repeat protein